MEDLTEQENKQENGPSTPSSTAVTTAKPWQWQKGNKYRLKKGDLLNPKGDTYIALMGQMRKDLITYAANPKKFAEIRRKLVNEAINGDDPRYMQMLLQYILGKPEQTLNINSNQAVNLAVALIDQTGTSEDVARIIEQRKQVVSTVVAEPAEQVKEIEAGLA